MQFRYALVALLLVGRARPGAAAMHGGGRYIGAAPMRPGAALSTTRGGAALGMRPDAALVHGGWRTAPARAACRLQSDADVADAGPVAPASTKKLKLKDLQAELDSAGVVWRGLCFERAELEQALVAARAAGPVASAQDAPPSDAAAGPAAAAQDAPPSDAAAGPAAAAQDAPPSDAAAAAAAASSWAGEDAYASAYSRAMGLKVKEIRAELAARGSGWADLFEKEQMAARLAALNAQAALFSASGAIEPGKVGQLTAAQLRQELADARTPLLLDVYATWCVAGPPALCAPVRDPPTVVSFDPWPLASFSQVWPMQDAGARAREACRAPGRLGACGEGRLGCRAAALH